ncbi:hypothetical protein CHU95_11635 [Niveispirillum lacus]|uniref:Uncharacterized protein n=1 Tax=Niveispirillum lacus TaxID=1981099 RepID=A0A255Z0C0_9PROT|nr:hypothetical protein [Niveispirillum lacus]OYQ34110.1 hypothetical protein CHU95_11635 [Niveispirillum lacus]
MAERKYAVQRPKGAKWETLSLVDDLGQGKQEFRNAVGLHGAGPVRLIQVDFVSDEALADFDWRLIELHDPRKGDRPKPTVVAGSERAKPKASAKAKAATGKAGPAPDEKVPVPVKTYVIAFLFGAVSLGLWAVFYRT